MQKTPTRSTVSFSRRDFLKWIGAGSLGVLAARLPGRLLQGGMPSDQQGRIADTSVSMYDIPSYEGKRLKIYWRDLVLPITGLAISDDETAYNRVWYEINREGYIYSGSVQPVRTVYNDPVINFPPNGALAEISVPYTDAREEPKQDAKLAYRLYYETTHWVIGYHTNVDEQRMYYRLYDDKYQSEYYAPSEHLRLLTAGELAPISPDVPRPLKLIQVRLGQQLVVAYEYSRAVFACRASTGARFRSGTYTTPLGTFITNYKRPSRHMAAGDLTANGYDLPGVPWVMYITEGGISIHGTYWHNDFGRPRSHGCINLPVRAARWLFRWTQPMVPAENQFIYKDYGTNVEIIE